MSTLKDILEQRGMPCCSGCGMRMKMMEGTCPDCGINYGLSMGAKNAPGMSEEKEEEPTANYKLDKIGRKIKASKIVFNQGEDDSTKRVQEHMKTTYKDMITAFSEMRAESLQLEDEINEVLSKDAAAGEWISDFVHSDNPKFAGKSKEKRKQMALAAYYAKQRNEEAEMDEELKGKQHKLDKNKNGKLDAEDFKKLRKEQLAEREDREDDEGYHRTKDADDAWNREMEAKQRAAAAKKKAAPKKTNEELDEAVNLSDYMATSEKSQFGGHRPHVVNKETGKTMHLSQHSYTSPEHAKSHAEAYLKAYAKTGANAADRAGIDYAKANKGHLKEEVDLDEAEYKISTAKMGHAGKTTIKHIKNPTVQQRMAAHDIKPGIAGYRDRIDALRDAKAKGNLKEDDMNETSPFDWKNTPRQTKDKTKTSTYHDVKKVSTGTVYTKQFDKDGTSKGTGEDAAKKAEGAAKRGRGRPRKDKFAESVEVLLNLSEEQFDSMMEDGFDAFFEAFEQLDELSKKTLGSYVKKSNIDAVNSASSHTAYGAAAKKASLDGDKKKEDNLKKSSDLFAKQTAKRQAGVGKAVERLMTKEDFDL